MESREDGKTIPEESPVKSSGSNGIVEKGVQEIEGQIRAIFLGFQDRMRRRVDTRERIVAFIPEYAAYLMNRMSMGQDGKVAYERIKGKKPTILGLEFGEKVLYKTRPTKDANVVLDARWVPGVFLGKTWGSTINRVMISPRKVIEVRGLQRVPQTERWDRVLLGDPCHSIPMGCSRQFGIRARGYAPIS